MRKNRSTYDTSINYRLLPSGLILYRFQIHAIVIGTLLKICYQQQLMHQQILRETRNINKKFLVAGSVKTQLYLEYNFLLYRVMCDTSTR